MSTHSHLLTLKIDRDSNQMPVYRQIATAIEADIGAGALAVGARLPTQRRLAQRLAVNVATITSAYANLIAKGLLESSPGRGTFVRAPSGQQVMPETAQDVAHATIDLSINRPASTAFADELAHVLPRLPRDRDFTQFQNYQPGVGRDRFREAGQAWVARSGWTVSADNIVVTCGVQHGLAVVAGACLSPGDGVLADRVTYYGLRAVARLFHLRLVGIDGDSEGMTPSAIDAACRSQPRVKAVFMVPTMHNPTTVTLSARRRQELAEAARRNGLYVIEDDVYGPLLAERAPPVSAFCPERSLYLSGTSKSLAPGLRLGFVAAPAELTATLGGCLRAISWMVQPMTAAIGARWIENDRVDAMILAQRQAISERFDLAGQLLAPYRFDGSRYCPHIWLHLPEPWRSEQFASFLSVQGVRVLGSEAFMVDRSQAPHAVRINLGAAASLQHLRHALNVVGSALDAGQPIPDGAAPTAP